MSTTIPRLAGKTLEAFAAALANAEDAEGRDVILAPGDVFRAEVVEQIAAHAISKLAKPKQPAKEKK